MVVKKRKISISVPEDFMQIVDEKVADGTYGSTSHALTAGLLLLFKENPTKHGDCCDE